MNRELELENNSENKIHLQSTNTSNNSNNQQLTDNCELRTKTFNSELYYLNVTNLFQFECVLGARCLFIEQRVICIFDCCFTTIQCQANDYMILQIENEIEIKRMN